MIRRADIRDVATLVDLAAKLWPDAKREELHEEFVRALASVSSFQFLIAVEDLKPVGFIQLSVRHDYVEGAERSPVGYVEGIYVETGWQKRGIGKQLMQEAEAWCHAAGLLELGSDVNLKNPGSQSFHLQCGFAEAEKSVHYIRKLSV